MGDFVAAAFARAGIDDWRSLVHTDPAFVRPVDATELVGDASLAHALLGWSPTVGFADVVARMVAADLVEPGHGVVGSRLLGLLLQRQGAALGVELDDAVRRRVGDAVAEHAAPSRSAKRRRREPRPAP